MTVTDRWMRVFRGCARSNIGVVNDIHRWMRGFRREARSVMLSRERLHLRRGRLPWMEVLHPWMLLTTAMDGGVPSMDVVNDCHGWRCSIHGCCQRLPWMEVLHPWDVVNDCHGWRCSIHGCCSRPRRRLARVHGRGAALSWRHAARPSMTSGRRSRAASPPGHACTSPSLACRRPGEAGGRSREGFGACLWNAARRVLQSTVESAHAADQVLR